MAIISYYKKYTETLALMLKRFRKEHPQYKESKITYAGRLDPMAEGLMILLTDEDVHHKQLYLKKEKTYQVDFIFGPTTDTLDILGYVDPEKSHKIGSVQAEKIISELSNFKNLKKIFYPHYSSKTVKGKPLWQYTREGLINTIDIPSKEINVHDATYLEPKVINQEIFLQQIINDINVVEGNFRQSKIITTWQKYFDTNPDNAITVHSIAFNVSSGTYIRSLVDILGKKLGIPATSVRITRTRIGDKILTL